MKKSRFIMVLLIALLAVSSVFASGAKEAQAVARPANELTVWAWDPTFNIAALRKAEALYQQTNPDFKLNIVENVYNDIQTKLITAAEAGDLSTLPDIFLMQNYAFQTYGTKYPQLFLDLTDSGINFDDFTASTVADSTVDGKNLGIPFDNSASIFAIRRDFVEQAGLKVEDFQDITWSRFIELGRIVKAKTGLPMITVSGGSEILIEMLQTAGASPWVDGKLNVANNEVLFQCMTIYKQLIDEGIMVDYTDWNEYIASFNNGKAAGLIQGNWILSSIQAAADQSGKWAIVNLPALDGVAGAAHNAACGGASWAVSSQANQELALDFLKSTFGSSTELYDELLRDIPAIGSYLPASTSALFSSPVEFYGGQEVYADIVDFSGKIPAFSYGTYYNEIRTALTDAITNVVQNNADIRSEMRAAEEAIQFSIEG